MWNEIWEFVYGNYIFHTVIALAIIWLVVSPGRLRHVFGKFRKIKAGPLEFQAGEEIDPNTPCPYTKSRDISFGAIREVEGKVGKVEEKVDKLSSEMLEVMAMVKNMSIDEQKSYFYSQNMPDAERLYAGLRYISQGGNGLTKPDVIKFAEANKELYNVLAKAKPELRITQ